MLFRFLQANPAVRLLLPLILGVLVGNYLNVSLFILAVLLIATFFIFLIISVLKMHSRHFYGILIALFFCCLGVFLVQKTKENNALPKDLGTQYVKAIVRGEAEEKVKSAAVVLEVRQIIKDGKVETTHFKSLTYFPKDSIVQKWQYGDTVIAKLQFLPLPKPMNPYAFDFGKLLSRRQIYVTAQGDLATVRHFSATKFSVFRSARAAQKRLSETLEKYIVDEKARGFLQAITLGDKTSLSPEVRVDFAKAGVVHVLAVSGLHVGILFLLVNFAFQFLKKTRKRRFILVAIGLLVIWSFAFVSGLSVSILRAAIMFSVLQLSVLSLRPYRIYNSIAVSMVLLLLINPFYLFELGFQLSYVAVLGIVTFVPMWNRKPLKNKCLESFKQLVLVSLAAQLGVAPLVLYYFHQLPTYFLLGNIIVLTLAPFLLGGSLLILLFAQVAIIAKPIAFLVEWLTKFCIFAVNGIATLPNAVLLNYSLDFWQMLMVFAILTVIIFYVFKRSKPYFSLLLLVLLCFGGYTMWRNYQENRQQIFVVHHLKGKSGYTLISGREAMLFYSKQLEEKEQNYAISPLLEAKNVKSVGDLQLNTKKRVVVGKSLFYKEHFLVNGKHIVRCPEKTVSLASPTTIDVLILANKADWKLALQNYKVETIVLDSSFSKSKSQKLAEELSALHYIVHNVNTDGAFILD